VLLIGVRNYKVDMLKNTRIVSTVVSAAVCLSGCGMMPGMQNLDTTQMRRVVAVEKVQVQPTLIPITPSLISQRRIATYFYRVASADVLNITVWQHPEFNAVETQAAAYASTQGVQGAAGQPGYLVDPTGRIYFPLIGYVHVAGKTVDKIRADISHRLRRFVPNPQVNVRVADYRGQKVYVLGEVMKPGFLPINDQRLTISDALALTGGINPDSADPRFIYVIRGDYLRPQIYWLNARTPDGLLLAERFSLQPRDILFVSSAPATRWNRALNQLLPTVQTIWYTQAIVNSR
jgi:polysaccharide export outer membrane protein